ncbi:MAG: hypothetical protein AAGK78_17280 [Planctomycetota bacterium]
MLSGTVLSESLLAGAPALARDHGVLSNPLSVLHLAGAETTTNAAQAGGADPTDDAEATHDTEPANAQTLTPPVLSPQTPAPQIPAPQRLTVGDRGAKTEAPAAEDEHAHAG